MRGGIRGWDPSDVGVTHRSGFHVPARGNMSNSDARRRQRQLYLTTHDRAMNAARRKLEMSMGLGFTFGLPLGAGIGGVLGAAYGNVGVGAAVGTVVGIAAGLGVGAAIGSRRSRVGSQPPHIGR